MGSALSLACPVPQTPLAQERSAYRPLLVIHIPPYGGDHDPTRAFTGSLHRFGGCRFWLGLLSGSGGPGVKAIGA